MKRAAKMRVRRTNLGRFAAVLLAAVFAACGFGPNYNNPAQNANVSTTPAASGVDHDIETMRTASFEFIFVFKRKDGEVLTADDKAYIKAIAQPEPNRFTLSEDERSVVAGSFYAFEPNVVKTLEKRFEVRDLSPEKTGDQTSNNSKNQSSENR